MLESHCPLLETPLESLGLTQKGERRLYHCLRRAGYATLEQVGAASDDDLLAVSGMGLKSMGLLRGRLAAAHLAPVGTRLGLLGLSDRPLAALIGRGVITREQASALTLADFLAVPGLTSASRMEVLEILELSGAAPPAPAAEAQAARPAPEALLKEGLDAWADGWLATLGHARQEEALRARYGLGGPPGRPAGGTAPGRQRAQQVEKAALLKLGRDVGSPYLPPFLALVGTLLAESGGLAGDAEVDALLRGRLNVGRLAPVSIARLALDAQAGRRTPHPNGLWVLAPLTEEHARAAQDGMVQALSGEAAVLGAAELLAASAALPSVCSFPDPAPPVERLDFLRACLRLHPHILRLGDRTGEGYVLARRQRLGALLIALAGRPRPVHYGEAAAAANAVLAPAQRADPEGLHDLMERHPALFHRLGHGRFKLASPDGPRDVNVPDAVCRVLGASASPLHHEEVTLRVLSDWEVAPTSVYAALNRDPRVQASGKGFFELRTPSAGAAPPDAAGPLVDVWRGMQEAARAGDMRETVRRINLQRKRSDVEMLIGRPLTRSEGRDLLSAPAQREFPALAGASATADRLMGLRQEARRLAARGDLAALLALLQTGLETAQAAAVGGVASTSGCACPA